MVKIYKGVPYSGTLPAVLTGTKAGYLHRYKVHGNTEQTGTPTPENPVELQECGERTEQIFDISKVDNGNAVTHNGETIRMNSAGFWYDLMSFTSGINARMVVSKSIFLKAGTYTIKIGEVIRTMGTGVVNGMVVFSTDGTDTQQIVSSYNIKNSKKTFTTPSDGYISVRISSGNPIIQGLMIVVGSTPPESYIPYGYKLPLLSGSTPVDIYIGDDTLSTEEYVDSGTGKIYRMVDGVLTPVDPPVPFPQIPTTANSTTISWGGQGLAPSEFDSIAEWVNATPKIYTNGAWVDAQTYTYDDGAWVADNSN